MSALKSGVVLLGGLITLLVAISVIATIGAISGGATGGVIAALLYVLGVWSLGTAKAVFLGFAAIGALIGVFNALIAAITSPN